MAGDEKPTLRPANENPWYCLATLQGEQGKDYNKDLAAKNRMSWNRWAAAGLEEAKRQALIEKGYDKAELIPFSESEAAKFRIAFAARVRREVETPAPSQMLDFSATKFDHPLDLSGFILPSRANFSLATFSADADFSRTSFVADADFIWASFAHYTYFRSATFSTKAAFIAATFSSGADFRLATFTANAYFRLATFFAKADFRSATFSADADFRSATFSADAGFRSAIFSADAYFRSATFSANAYFRSATFSVDAYFRSATFSAKADFIGVKFGGQTEFVETVFRRDVPEFRGASLHEATEWDDVVWPAPADDRNAARRQVYAYQRLKQEMEKLKKHEDELLFFRKELRAKRGTFATLSPSWVLNALYDGASNYGQSAVRPLSWLLALFVLGAVVFVRIENTTSFTWHDAVALSFSNIFGLLGVKRDFFDAATIAKFPQSVLYISAAQSIVGTILLFLFGLALRNRFRIK